MGHIRAVLYKFGDEIGLKTLVKSSSDVFIIICLRMIRLVGFGATSLILALYLNEISFDEESIGFFMTITFVGDLISSFILAVAADRIGRKNVLILSSIVMSLTGVCFFALENKLILTVVAFVGILTPSGGEVGPFRSVEQSSIASIAPYEQRSDVYAWYTFLGTFCAALGSVLSGKLIDYCNKVLEYPLIKSYKMVFLGYTLLSILTLVLSCFLSHKVEWSTEVASEESGQIDNEREGEPSEASQLLSGTSSKDHKKHSKQWKFLPSLDLSVLVLVTKLSLLFALDSFASSLVPMSWQSYYIKYKFNALATYLGSIFFVTGIVSGFMSLLGTSLNKRLGPVVTMVVTHLPASILLALVPLPNSLSLTMAILVIRASTQTMDVAPKHVFLATIVPPESRTAIFGWVNVVKTLAQVVGPSIVGILTHHNSQWISFVIAGVLKATYDIGILGTFLAFNRHQQH
ncbi:uncharacterized protein PRCAT00001491001 [Priceomyces carsonii]|uniref:uncharacterized protein n=1 Tax=Priceomyces carsonii TaxID=28549 RepID=UPI002ED96315|nr:unnamed protein product [Priceomyces carsonii]